MSKTPHDQLREIEKLIADAERLLDQARYALGTLSPRPAP